MRVLLILLFCFQLLTVSGQIKVAGTVYSETDREVLGNASVRIGDTYSTVIEGNGYFEIIITPGDYPVKVSSVGHITGEYSLNLERDTVLAFYLTRSKNLIDEVEVVSTGYYSVPKERATGSFEYIDESLFNRNTAPDIVSRLEGVVSGLAFDRRNETSESPSLRMRGVSSIHTSNDLLIILNNFPFEGNIRDINPNDVASITFLKDAAASSIWGARAGNGVLVITTKSARYDTPVNVQANSNLSLTARPDPTYGLNHMTSKSFIAFERELFERGYYPENEWTSLTPAVELMIREREGLMTSDELENQLSALAQTDVRKEAKNLLYRTGHLQQHHVNIRGGSSKNTYYMSAAYDREAGTSIGDRNSRFTLNLNNTFKISENTELSTILNWSKINAFNNGLDLDGIQANNNKRLYPYARLLDETGAPAPVHRDYKESYLDEMANHHLLMDWRFRPLEERELNNHSTGNTGMNIMVGLRQKILANLSFDIKYRYHQDKGEGEYLQDADSYYVRDLVNQFTQDDGRRIFPEGGVLMLNHDNAFGHNLRGQVDYNLERGDIKLFSLLGGEISHQGVTGKIYTHYGYDEEVLTTQQQLDFVTWYPVRPQASGRLPQPNNLLTENVDRFVSTFFNGTISYKDRYNVSTSMRWDASNLFGVRTNQKGVPLWSVGLKWNVEQEGFMEGSLFDQLDVRATYGYSGNIDRFSTAYTVSSYVGNSMVDLPMVLVRTPGNPSLRWERLGTLNLGLDVALNNHRLSASLDYYVKYGRDLFGAILLNPTLGYNIGSINTVKTNNADQITKGVDLKLGVKLIDQRFKWDTDLLFNYTVNRVTEYTGTEDVLGYASNFGVSPSKGKSIDAMYTIPWIGLDPETGGPLVNVGGDLGTDYTEYFRNLNSLDSLKYNGLTFPPYFGMLRNSFGYGKWHLSFSLAYKFGYVFKRTSIDYYSLFNSHIGHQDFEKRWKRPGDESTTDIPSLPAVLDQNRETAYRNSEVLVERGDHIRLQDVRFSYDINLPGGHGATGRAMQVYCFASNLGFMWKKSRYDIDPDRPSARMPVPWSVSFGLNVKL